MRCVVGIDLGSTTTKAVLMDEHGAVLGQGITNSRSNYEVACAVAHEEALLSARRGLVERAIAGLDGDGNDRAPRPVIAADQLLAVRTDECVEHINAPISRRNARSDELAREIDCLTE